MCIYTRLNNPYRSGLVHYKVFLEFVFVVVCLKIVIVLLIYYSPTFFRPIFYHLRSPAELSIKQLEASKLVLYLHAVFFSLI